MKMEALICVRVLVPFDHETQHHDHEGNEAVAEKHSKERRAAAKYAEKEIVNQVSSNLPGKVVQAVVEEVREVGR